MSSQELNPFFPSATHPALPIAAQLLSTLRALTAPGKGNDLRPEERAALVGVSALLGCERVQSHDLLESAAQRLASVAPAHFKSALSTARRLLASDTSSRSPRTRTSTQSQPSSPSERSPFATPKKKYKYASGVDLSGLLTPTPHKAAPSPLRQSVTPSKRSEKRPGMAAVEEDDNEEKDDEDPLLLTPTKRKPRPSMQDKLSAARKDKERVGAEAFLAMRPDGAPAPAAVVSAPARVARYDPSAHTGTGKIRKLRERADWTFRERVWARPDAGSVWRRLELDLDLDRALPDLPKAPNVPTAPKVPELIVTDDEQEPERTPTRTTPRMPQRRKTPKSGKDKGTPTQTTQPTPKAAGPSLDSIIIAAWA